MWFHVTGPIYVGNVTWCLGRLKAVFLTITLWKLLVEKLKGCDNFLVIFRVFLEISTDTESCTSWGWYFNPIIYDGFGIHPFPVVGWEWDFWTINRISGYPTFSNTPGLKPSPEEFGPAVRTAWIRSVLGRWKILLVKALEIVSLVTTKMVTRNCIPGICPKWLWLGLWKKRMLGIQYSVFCLGHCCLEFLVLKGSSDGFFFCAECFWSLNVGLPTLSSQILLGGTGAPSEIFWGMISWSPIVCCWDFSTMEMLPFQPGFRCSASRQNDIPTNVCG